MPSTNAVETAGKRIILHVGLHKTATTFLQERVFPNLPGVAFVHPLHRPQPGDGPIERFMLELFFRNAASIDLARHAEEIGEWLAGVDAPTVLISSEAIVGWPIENHSNFAVNADMLHALFPNAQIWLVVRRQDKWVESAYAQLLKAGFSTSIERYLNWDGQSFDRYNVGLYNGPNVDARDLDWGAFDRWYRRSFGKDAVLTLPFELFADDSAAFLRAFYEFAGIEGGVFPDTSERVNERWSPLASTVARMANKVPMPIKRAIRRRIGNEWHPAAIVSRTIDPLVKQRKRPFLSEEVARALMELHRDNNAVLGRQIGRDLSGWGY